MIMISQESGFEFTQLYLQSHKQNSEETQTKATLAQSSFSRIVQDKTHDAVGLLIYKF